MTLPDWMDRVVLGNPLRHWTYAVVGALAVTLAITIAKSVVTRRLQRIAARTETAADDFALELLKAVRPGLVVAMALGAAVRLLELRPAVDHALAWVVVIAFVVQARAWVNCSVDFWVAQYERKSAGRADRTTLSALRIALRVAFWVAVLAIAVEILGKSFATLLTGLGIGGIAIALALQNILGDLFGALSIVLDKPFVVGDTIGVDELEGTVEHIGLKTTRVKSVNGEQLVFSNSDLLKSRLRNLSRREGRRMVFTMTVAPTARAEQVARVPAIIAEVVAAEPRATLQRAHLVRTGALGFDVETAIQLPIAEGHEAFDVRQAILLAIVARLEREEIQLAHSATVATPPAPPAA